jgi:UDP-galactopyranose mutase
MNQEKKRILIVGCGLSGAVIAERCASQLDFDVTIIDKRNHIGGNCYDYIDPETKIRISQYGAHLFHTNSHKVWSYVQQFSEWIRYDHRVVAKVKDQHVPLPIHMTTINQLCNQHLSTEEEMKEYLDQVRTQFTSVEEIKTSEDICLARFGPTIYETLFKPYTFKQWNKDPSELDRSVCERIPLRYNMDNRYFSCKYQALPKDGYTTWIQRMLDHPNIKVQLSVDFFQLSLEEKKEYDWIVYTGPIDHYFAHVGMEPLEYRSIRFEHEIVPIPLYQPHAVVNYPSDEVAFTRIIEYKHFPIQCQEASKDKTFITREYSTSEGDPYYPVPTERNQQLYQSYKELAMKETNVHFLGRLASYKYVNMDEAILLALHYFEEHLLVS